MDIEEVVVNDLSASFEQMEVDDSSLDTQSKLKFVAFFKCLVMPQPTFKTTKKKITKDTQKINK